MLNIETSSPVCSVCLSKDSNIIDYREDMAGTSHARLLTIFIDELFKQNHISMKELDAVAISSGPGSYTGLRVGFSVAKGLCYALEKPLISIPTLLALFIGMKQKVNNESAFYLPVMDARRMDIYTALYKADGKEMIPASAPTVNTSFEEMLIHYGQIYVGGNAASKCKQVFTSPFIHYVEGIDCDSRTMIMLAEKKFQEQQFEDVAYFEPRYLKEFGAK
ncbi:MAG: tRNA (adenosine(37)-N6)-threonylcarbamoyltransferase complex dimerization subunit type 1 TsaB [Bacteroidetes bacterium]|nr:tRNA (adenosine(37)-N6)-threonylcarbamoyltransferase complex dimerization subunit type 1 TsaB [Bacteroidota bacterium]